MKFKISVLLTVILLVASGCSSPATQTTTQPAEIPPTPYPDTPAPAVIDAPIIEAPALVTFQFLSELDGWGVTETQIVRTNDGAITWYNVTPPTVTETGYSVETFVLDAAHRLQGIHPNLPWSGQMIRSPFARPNVPRTFDPTANAWQHPSCLRSRPKSIRRLFRVSYCSSHWTSTQLKEFPVPGKLITQTQTSPIQPALYGADG